MKKDDILTDGKKYYIVTKATASFVTFKQICSRPTGDSNFEEVAPAPEISNLHEPERKKIRNGYVVTAWGLARVWDGKNIKNR